MDRRLRAPCGGERLEPPDGVPGPTGFRQVDAELRLQLEGEATRRERVLQRGSRRVDLSEHPVQERQCAVGEPLQGRFDDRLGWALGDQKVAGLAGGAHPVVVDSESAVKPGSAIEWECAAERTSLMANGAQAGRHRRDLGRESVAGIVADAVLEGQHPGQDAGMRGEVTTAWA